MLLFCAANLRCDNAKGGDNNHRDGRPADNRRALLEHRLEAERRADRRNAKQNRRDDKASELRVPDKQQRISIHKSGDARTLSLRRCFLRAQGKSEGAVKKFFCGKIIRFFNGLKLKSFKMLNSKII